MKGMDIIGNFIFFDVLPCFFPKLNTLAAQKAHYIEKHPPITPFARFLPKDSAKMNATKKYTPKSWLGGMTGTQPSIMVRNVLL